MFKEKTDYSVNVYCSNCDSLEVLKIKKGKKVSVFLNDEMPDCNNCDCLLKQKKEV